jgi:hypothetical protein
MTLIEILQYVALVGTILTGLVSLIRPQAVRGFTGLNYEGGRGITEIRSILGGLFVALGLAPLILNDPAAFKMLGIVYLGIAVVRTPAMFIDQSVENSNIISVVVEVIFGVILIL